MSENNDRELLEKAAKVAGMEHMRWSGPMGLSRMLDPSRPATTGSIGPYWNPLTDDGDALRLAVKLGLDDMLVLTVGCSGASVEFDNRVECSYEAHEHSGDPYAATRRAIVRAAASIGDSHE
jgi:hypothetical protein